MTGPAAERLTHRAFRLLSYGRINSYGLSALAPKLAPMAECRAVLTYLQVWGRLAMGGCSRGCPRCRAAAPAARPARPPTGLACGARSLPLQAILGFLLPALVHAILETHLFLRHQQQRRRAGVAGEAGWQAAVYTSLAGLLEVLTWPQAVLALGVLLSICFDLSLLASGA